MPRKGAQVRYDRSHPLIRLDRETYEKCRSLLRGRSFSALVRELLEQNNKLKEEKERAWNEGYRLASKEREENAYRQGYEKGIQRRQKLREIYDERYVLAAKKGFIKGLDYDRQRDASKIREILSLSRGDLKLWLGK